MVCMHARYTLYLCCYSIHIVNIINQQRSSLMIQRSMFYLSDRHTRAMCHANMRELLRYKEALYSVILFSYPSTSRLNFQDFGRVTIDYIFRCCIRFRVLQSVFALRNICFLNFFELNFSRWDHRMITPFSLSRTLLNCLGNLFG